MRRPAGRLFLDLSSREIVPAAPLPPRSQLLWRMPLTSVKFVCRLL
jgi:hypothetical protein